MQGESLPAGGHQLRERRLLRAFGGPPRELWAGVAAALVSMVVVAWFGRHFWFRYDNFPLLAGRQISSLNDWFRPHHDHWLTWTVLVSHALYRTVGVHYWPWWYLPRLIGNAAVAFLIWRMLVYRRADKIVAFGAYLALLMLAVSYFQDALTVANYVLFPCVIVVALFVSETETPRPRDLVIVGAALVAALMANGYGLAALLAVAVVVTAKRRLRPWAPALIPPACAVVLWYLWYRSELRHHDHAFSPSFVRESIDSSFVVVRTAIENTFGLVGPLAALVVVAIAGFLAWLIYRRRLDMFDAIIGLTVAFVLVILAWARSSQVSQAETVRYGYAIVLLLTLLVVPHLRLPAEPIARGAVALVLVAVVAFNVVSLSRRLDQTGEVSQSIRVDAATTAALIAAGEPYSDFGTIGRGVEPRLIHRLVEDGWTPHRSDDARVVSRVRTHMRFVLGGAAARSALTAPGHVAPAARGVGPDGCVRTAGAAVVDLRVTGAGGFRVSSRVVLTWTDRFAAVRATAGPAVVGLARPAGTATVSVRTITATKVCSLRPLAPSGS